MPSPESHPVEIITLPPSEWRAYREARLRALSQDPQAFSSTYAETAQRHEAWWQARLQSVAGGRDWLFFARRDGELVGLLGAYRPPDTQATAIVISVHVDRARRGQGIGARLMAHLLLALQAAGIKRVLLSVHPGQAAAIALYRKFGFAMAAEQNEPGEQVLARELP